MYTSAKSPNITYTPVNENYISHHFQPPLRKKLDIYHAPQFKSGKKLCLMPSLPALSLSPKMNYRGSFLCKFYAKYGGIEVIFNVLSMYNPHHASTLTGLDIIPKRFCSRKREISRIQKKKEPTKNPTNAIKGQENPRKKQEISHKFI